MIVIAKTDVSPVRKRLFLHAPAEIHPDGVEIRHMKWYNHSIMKGKAIFHENPNGLEQRGLAYDR